MKVKKIELKPVRRAKWEQHRGVSPLYSVRLSFRPVLNMWDVEYVPTEDAGRHNWYMFTKASRHTTRNEALIWLMDLCKVQQLVINNVIHTKESLMKIEIITTIGGIDSRKLSDEDLVEVVRGLYKKEADLQALSNKVGSVKVSNMASQVTRDLRIVVELLDQRAKQ